MEACASAHYWAREIGKLGHHVRLIVPACVKPFIKRQKNDAADADAVVVRSGFRERPESLRDFRYLPGTGPLDARRQSLKSLDREDTSANYSCSESALRFWNGNHRD